MRIALGELYRARRWGGNVKTAATRGQHGPGPDRNPRTPRCPGRIVQGRFPTASGHDAAARRSCGNLMTVRRRVMIADDHQIVRQGLRALMEKAGHVIVAEAANGREAVDLAAAQQIDIAVLDLLMPILNGVDAAREPDPAIDRREQIDQTDRPDSGHQLQDGRIASLAPDEEARHPRNGRAGSLRGAPGPGPAVGRLYSPASGRASRFPYRLR